VSEWASASGTMAPWQATEILETPYGLFAISEEKQLLGHIALTEYDPMGTSRVGALVKNPEARGLRVGPALIEKLLDSVAVEFPDLRSCEAYTHYRGEKLFRDAGGIFVDYRNPTVNTGCNYIVDLSRTIKNRRAALAMLAG
jgi:predicted GNAT family N-acyltransferase